VSRQGRLARAAASGILLFAAFPPLDQGYLAWVALTPLLVSLRDVPPRQAFGLGALAGTLAYLGIVSWMRVFGILPWILLAVYLGLFVGVFAALWRWVGHGRRPWVAVATAPLLWTLLEYLRSIGVMGFPWALLGLTQWRWPVVIHLASATGVFGVSFIVALASAGMAQWIADRRPGLLGFSVLTVAAVVIWGLSKVPPAAVGDLQIAALQPNIPAREKFDPLAAPDHMDILRDMVDEAGRRGASLIVFPETAIPYNLFGAGGVLREVGGWANAAEATVIASSLEGGTSNIAVAIAPSGQAVSRYDKVRLVAFGEYGIRPGRRHEPLWTPLGRVGVAVCFESIFPDVGRALARNGADLLAVITNDGWLDGTSGVAQHASHSVFRAVETGRWVVRAANTGVTMVVDPSGRIRGRIAPGTRGVLVGVASLRSGATVYSQVGDLFVRLVLLASAAIALPRLRLALAQDLGRPAFRQGLAAIGLPLITVWLLLGSRPEGIWPGVLMAFVVILSALRPRREWGFVLPGFVPALGAGLVVVGILWSTLALAFRAYGIPLGMPVPSGGWLSVVIRQFVIALAIEGWLRGIAFVPLAEWLGGGTAAAVGTAAGMLLQRGLGAEAIAWAMVTGAAFGLIRARTRNALGLVIPHALGNVLFSIVAAVR